jgi:alpha-glucosidase
VTIYLPKDQFYDFLTYAPVKGNGAAVHLTNVPYTSIPLHIKGGTVLPLRASSANTTTELRLKDFEITIAPGTDGTAYGQLYIDDGVSIRQKAPVTFAKFRYSHGTLYATGQFASTNRISLVSFLGVTKAPKSVTVNGKPVPSSAIAFDKTHSVVRAKVSIPLSHGFTVYIS